MKVDIPSFLIKGDVEPSNWRAQLDQTHVDLNVQLDVMSRHVSYFDKVILC